MVLKTSILQLVMLLVFFTSCYGQVKEYSPKVSDNKVNVIIGVQPKMSRGFIQDKKGNFWLCNGKNEGVTFYDGKKYTHYTEKDGLSSNFVYTILEDNIGKIWFGTADGLSCFEGNKFTTIPISTVTGSTSHRKTTADPLYGFPQPVENWVNCILQDNNGSFWFGTMTGIYRFDGKTFSRFALNDNIIKNTGSSNKGVESIIQDKKGNIWFGGRGTVGVFRYDGKSLTNFKPDNENWVYPLMEDKSGNIWFSKRTRGVYSYNGNTFALIGEKEFTDFFFSMAQNSDGNIWFGQGKNGGVTFFDGKTFINYSAKDGLCNVFMRWIVKGKDGNIWFNCEKNHLCRYDGKAFTNISGKLPFKKLSNK